VRTRPAPEVAAGSRQPVAEVAGSRQPVAEVAAGSRHPEAKVDSFREAVDWSPSTFFLSCEMPSISATA
jgi:hypothetical protein